MAMHGSEEISRLRQALYEAVTKSTPKDRKALLIVLRCDIDIHLDALKKEHPELLDHPNQQEKT
jgi:hypothetical protein